jgi:ribonucleotide monophosphatase NagD (HAD superfamily)
MLICFSNENRDKYMFVFISKEQIICTAWITAQYLKSINFKGHCYCVGMQSMVEELGREGFHISDGIGVSSINVHFSYCLISFDSLILFHLKQIRSKQIRSSLMIMYIRYLFQINVK